MCGIIGIAGDDATADRARMVAGRDLMRHRGPDDAGLWEAPGISLAARRLAILDLSPAGHQPMLSSDARDTIVFNGEVYNCAELQRELRSDFRFRGHSDTEVMLNGYRRWGLRGLVDRADGMFAFAIWDGSRRRLSIARDRVGKKPLFYSHQGRSLYFASVLNVLLEILPRTPEIDPHALDAFLVYQAVPAPLSMFHGVRQLQPAHTLTFDAATGACAVERYWSVSYRSKTTETEGEVVEHVTSLARTAVRKRLMADVPVGVFLSGGVDSSIVASLAAEEHGAPIEAVTMGFGEAEYDERRYARAVAARAGIRLHEDVLKPELVADLPGIVWHYGQPVADVSIVPNHYLSAAAVRWMRVALNGDGGDELFGGYARPLVERAAGPYRRLLPPNVRQWLGAKLSGFRSRPWRRLSMLAHSGSTSAADAFTYDRAFRGVRDAAYADGLRSAVGDWHPDSVYRRAWDAADADEDVDRALAGDFGTYLPDQLLAKADIASMAHSLEARSPLLDTALIEYAARIPNALRFRHLQTKYLLKQVAAQFAPNFVIHRRKRGFVMPASIWLRGSLAPYVRGALDNPTFFDRGWIAPVFVRRMLEEHACGVRDWSENIFTLLVLEVWARITLDRTLGRDGRMDVFLSTPDSGPRTRIRTLQLGMGWFTEQPGGLNRVYAELTRHLPEAAVGVHGLVAGGPAVSRESGGQVEGIVPVVAPLFTRISAFFRRGRAAVRGDPDRLLVAHFALYARPVIGALGARPFVVHFQGPWGLEAQAERHSRVGVALKTAVEASVYRRATALIVLSSPFGKILENQFGIPPERIHVIPGGVDVDRFATAVSKADCRAQLGWPADRKIVLAVRRLAWRMGLDDLIGATAVVRERDPSVLVLIAGTGSIADSLEHAVRRAGLDEHVRLLGFVPDELLPCAYRAADLSIVPSEALEGFGLSAVESLAAGTPCLVTPVGGLPEVVEQLSPSLLLASTGPEALAAGLIAALSGEMSVPSAAECEAYARAKFDWPVIAEQTRQVYESVAGSRA